MLAACFEPDVACEITLQPIRRYDVDAAILFSDIVVPLRAAGVDLDIVADVGPVIADPVRTAADVAAMKPLDPQAIQPVLVAASLLVAELGDVPLIGFAGAPFTLASYLVEGGPSRHHAHVKAMMLAEPASWHALMAKLTDLTIAFLVGQIDAGWTPSRYSTPGPGRSRRSTTASTCCRTAPGCSLRWASMACR